MLDLNLDDFDRNDAILDFGSALWPHDGSGSFYVRKSKTQPGYYGTLRTGGSISSDKARDRGTLRVKARGATKREVRQRILAQLVVKFLRKRRVLGPDVRVSISWPGDTILPASFPKIPAPDEPLRQLYDIFRADKPPIFVAALLGDSATAAAVLGCDEETVLKVGACKIPRAATWEQDVKDIAGVFRLDPLKLDALLRGTP